MKDVSPDLIDGLVFLLGVLKMEMVDPVIKRHRILWSVTFVNLLLVTYRDLL